MFVQHKQLQTLQVAPDRVSHLHTSSSPVQLAFVGFTPQLCQAYLARLEGRQKVLIVVAYYLTESQQTVFFVPRCGEVEYDKADEVYEEGYAFVESMGFVLTETDYHLLAGTKKQRYWQDLPISQRPAAAAAGTLSSASQSDRQRSNELQQSRSRCRESLGRLLASL